MEFASVFIRLFLLKSDEFTFLVLLCKSSEILINSGYSLYYIILTLENYNMN